MPIHNHSTCLRYFEIGQQRLGRALVGDLAAVEHVGAIGERQDQIEVVLDDQDRHLAAQRIEGPEDLLGHGGGEPLERLVEQEEPDVAGERAGDRHHLPLAAREHVRLAREALAHAREVREDPLAVPVHAGAALPAQAAHREVLVHGEVREQTPALRDQADAQARDLFGRPALDLLALVNGRVRCAAPRCP